MGSKAGGEKEETDSKLGVTARQYANSLLCNVPGSRSSVYSNADKPLHPSQSQADAPNGIKKTFQKLKKMSLRHTGYLAKSRSIFP